MGNRKLKIAIKEIVEKEIVRKIISQSVPGLRACDIDVCPLNDI